MELGESSCKINICFGAECREICKALTVGGYRRFSVHDVFFLNKLD